MIANADALDYERQVAARVREMRRERGWSQATLCRRLCEAGWPMDQTVLSNLERGERPLRLAEVAALAAQFGVSPLSLLAVRASGNRDAALAAAVARADEARCQMHALLDVYAAAHADAHVLAQLQKRGTP